MHATGALPRAVERRQRSRRMSRLYAAPAAMSTRDSSSCAARVSAEQEIVVQRPIAGCAKERWRSSTAPSRSPSVLQLLATIIAFVGILAALMALAARAGARAWRDARQRPDAAPAMGRGARTDRADGPYGRPAGATGRRAGSAGAGLCDQSTLVRLDAASSFRRRSLSRRCCWHCWRRCWPESIRPYAWHAPRRRWRCGKNNSTSSYEP